MRLLIKNGCRARHAYDVTGEPVEWAQSWYRGDRYKFVTRLRRTPDQ